MEQQGNVNKKISYREDREKFLQQCYRDAVERLEDLIPEFEENTLFYRGIDRKLDERADDPEVSRSAFFVPLLKPAIDTRVSDGVSRLCERPNPVSCTPVDQDASPEIRNIVAKNEVEINRICRENGYIPSTFEEHAMAAEIGPLAALKVGWLETSKKVPMVTQKSIMGIPIARPKVIWQKQESGMPFAELLHYEEFLWQPHVSDFQRDSMYAGHRMWKTPDQLRKFAADFELDMDVVEDAIDGMNEKAGEGDSSVGTDLTTESARDSLEQEMGEPPTEGYRDNKILCVEWYIVDIDKNGMESIRQIYWLGKGLIAKDIPSPYYGIRFPFVPMVSNKIPGRLEGVPSVTIGKAYQKVYNEGFNTYLDAVSYRSFPPFLMDSGLKFKVKPKWGLGKFWRVSDLNGMRPVVENPGELPNLPPLLVSIKQALDNALDAPDLSQGMQDNKYEKATSAKLRSIGSARRGTRRHRIYGEAVVATVKMFISLLAQKAPEEDRLRWAVSMNVDVPTLTSITDPYKDLQDLQMLQAAALTNPVYAGTAGLRKIRALTEEITRRTVKANAEQYVPSEAELEQEIAMRAEMETLAMKQQAIAGQMQLENQGQPPANSGPAQKGPKQQ